MHTKTHVERKNSKVIIMLIALLVGITIGVVFKLLKLVVPVPHDFAGIFVGRALVDVAITSKVKGESQWQTSHENS